LSGTEEEESTILKLLTIIMILSSVSKMILSLYCTLLH